MLLIQAKVVSSMPEVSKPKFILDEPGETPRIPEELDLDVDMSDEEFLEALGAALYKNKKIQK